MKKQLMVMENGVKVAKEFSLEDVLVKFDAMISKTARELVDNPSLNLKLEFEDVKQELIIKVMHTFNRYDIAYGTCFSTVLVNDLYSMRSGIITDGHRQKRYAQHCATSTDSVISESNDGQAVTIGDTIQDETENVEAFVTNKELVQAINEFVTTDIEKDMLLVIINPKVSGRSLAEKWNMSPQGFNKKIKKFRTELQNYLAENGFGM